MKLDGLPGLNVPYWTTLAKECYSINCECAKCSFIPDEFKKKCNVKSYVLSSYRKFGKPEGLNDKVIRQYMQA